jgi:hypothetical protein
MTGKDWMREWESFGCWVVGHKINHYPFAFVYLDGEHTPQAVSEELAWFMPRMHPQGLVVIDDIESIKDSEQIEVIEAWRTGKVFGNRLYVPAICHEQDKFANVFKNNGQPKYAVVTIACGEDYRKIARLTHPTLKKYADRIGADFISIEKSDRSSPHWMKFELYNLLDLYQRVIYLDTDLLVREDCPNLLEIVSAEKIGLFNEAPFVEGRGESLRQAAIEYSLMVPDWDGAYYNTGVMVLSRCHQYLFRHPGKEVQNFFEQSYINLMIAVTKTPIHKLSFRFNRMTCTDSATGEERHGSWIIHYAGWQNLYQVLQTIRGDVRRWKEIFNGFIRVSAY